MGAPQPFAKVKSTDRDLNLVQDAIKKSLDPLIKNPLAGSSFKPGIALVAGSNLVSHGLGRNFRSYFVGNPSAPATLSTGTSTDPSKFISIVASAPVVVDLLVF